MTPDLPGAADRIDKSGAAEYLAAERGRECRAEARPAYGFSHPPGLSSWCTPMPTNPAWIRQAAAIPVRDGKLCLVTSTNGKRWVIPKGLIDPGQTAGETALQETWEEAGLVGVLQPDPVGSYLYEKFGGTCYVVVFVMHVTEEAEDWPERAQRQRVWLTSTQALQRVEDAGLREVIRGAQEQDRLKPRG